LSPRAEGRARGGGRDSRFDPALRLRPLSAKLGVPLQRINTIINGKRGVTPETALLLSRFFETTAEFWMNLQTKYDLWMAASKMAG
jgi:addiction module HigA family antidote